MPELKDSFLDWESLGVAAPSKQDEEPDIQQEQQTSDNFIAFDDLGYGEGKDRPLSKLEKSKAYWEAGRKSMDADFKAYRIMTNGGKGWEEFEPEAKKAEEDLFDPRLKGFGLGHEAWSGAMQMGSGLVGGMIQGANVGAQTGTAAGAAGAMYGAAGGTIVGPAGTAAGAAGVGAVSAAAGFTAGMAAGGAEYWSKQGAGMVYSILRQNGVPHDKAASTAVTVGIPYGAIELLQAGKLAPAGLKNIVKNQLKGIIEKEGVKKAAARQTGNIAKQTGQEVVQEGMVIAGEQYRGVDTQAYEGEDQFSAIGRRLGETAKQSALSFGVLQAGPAAFDITTSGIEASRAADAQRIINEAKEKAINDKTAANLDENNAPATAQVVREKSSTVSPTFEGMDTGAKSFDESESVPLVKVNEDGTESKVTSVTQKSDKDREPRNLTGSASKLASDFNVDPDDDTLYKWNPTLAKGRFGVDDVWRVILGRAERVRKNMEKGDFGPEPWFPDGGKEAMQQWLDRVDTAWEKRQKNKAQIAAFNKNKSKADEAGEVLFREPEQSERDVKLGEGEKNVQEAANNLESFDGGSEFKKRIDALPPVGGRDVQGLLSNAEAHWPADVIEAARKYSDARRDLAVAQRQAKKARETTATTADTAATAPDVAPAATASQAERLESMGIDPSVLDVDEDALARRRGELNSVIQDESSSPELKASAKKILDSLDKEEDAVARKKTALQLLAFAEANKPKEDTAADTAADAVDQQPQADVAGEAQDLADMADAADEEVSNRDSLVSVIQDESSSPELRASAQIILDALDAKEGKATPAAKTSVRVVTPTKGKGTVRAGMPVVSEQEGETVTRVMDKSGVKIAESDEVLTTTGGKGYKTLKAAEARVAKEKDKDQKRAAELREDRDKAYGEAADAKDRLDNLSSDLEGGKKPDQKEIENAKAELADKEADLKQARDDYNAAVERSEDSFGIVHNDGGFEAVRNRGVRETRKADDSPVTVVTPENREGKEVTQEEADKLLEEIESKRKEIEDVLAVLNEIEGPSDSRLKGNIKKWEAIGDTLLDVLDELTGKGGILEGVTIRKIEFGQQGNHPAWTSPASEDRGVLYINPKLFLFAVENSDGSVNRDKVRTIAKEEVEHLLDIEAAYKIEGNENGVKGHFIAIAKQLIAAGMEDQINAEYYGNKNWKKDGELKLSQFALAMEYLHMVRKRKMADKPLRGEDKALISRYGGVRNGLHNFMDGVRKMFGISSPQDLGRMPALASLHYDAADNLLRESSKERQKLERLFAVDESLSTRIIEVTQEMWEQIALTGGKEMEKSTSDLIWDALFRQTLDNAYSWVIDQDKPAAAWMVGEEGEFNKQVVTSKIKTRAIANARRVANQQRKGGTGKREDANDPTVRLISLNAIEQTMMHAGINPFEASNAAESRDFGDNVGAAIENALASQEEIEGAGSKAVTVLSFQRERISDVLKDFPFWRKGEKEKTVELPDDEGRVTTRQGRRVVFDEFDDAIKWINSIDWEEKPDVSLEVTERKYIELTETGNKIQRGGQAELLDFGATTTDENGNTVRVARLVKPPKTWTVDERKFVEKSLEGKRWVVDGGITVSGSKANGGSVTLDRKIYTNEVVKDILVAFIRNFNNESSTGQSYGAAKWEQIADAVSELKKHEKKKNKITGRGARAVVLRYWKSLTSEDGAVPMPNEFIAGAKPVNPDQVDARSRLYEAMVETFVTESDRGMSDSALGNYDFIKETAAKNEAKANEVASMLDGTIESLEEAVKLIESTPLGAESSERGQQFGEVQRVFLAAKLLPEAQKLANNQDLEISTKAGNLASKIASMIQNIRTESAQVLSFQRQVNKFLMSNGAEHLFRQTVRRNHQTKLDKIWGLGFADKLQGAWKQLSLAAVNRVNLDDAAKFVAGKLGIDEKSAKALLRKAMKAAAVKGIDGSGKQSGDTLYQAIKEQKGKLNKLSDSDIATINNVVWASWHDTRLRLINKEFIDKLVAYGMTTLDSGDKSKLSNSLGRIIKFADLGLLNIESFYEAIAPEYGLETVNGETATRLRELAERASEAPEGPIKNKIVSEMLAIIQSSSELELKDIARDFWYASVLSGVRTQVDIGLWSSLNGLLTALQASAHAVGKTKSAADGLRVMSGFVNTLGDSLRETFDIIKTGDVYRTIDATQRIEDQERVADYVGLNTLETLAKKKDASLFEKFISNYKYVRRSVIALDHLGSLMTREAMIMHAAMTSGDESMRTEAMRKLSKKEWDEAKKQAEKEWIASTGEKPKKVDITARARQILEAKVNDGVLSDASNMGTVVALNSDPVGFLGVVHSLFTSPKAGPLRHVLGLSFIRAAFNMMQQSANYFPVLGAVNYMRASKSFQIKKDGGVASGFADMWNVEVNDQRKTMIMMNQMTGLGLTLAAASYFLRPDDDDEERMFEISGTWAGLTPAQRSQLLSEGKKPLSIRVGGTWYEYKNSAIGAPLAVIGSGRDMQLYRKEDWDENEFYENVAAAVMGGGIYFKDFSMLSSFSQAVGIQASSREPVQGIEKAVAGLVAPAARAVEAFIPVFGSSLAKEVETIINPKYYTDRYGGSRLKRDVTSGVAVVRALGGKPMLNVLGEEVKIRRLPWSRLIKTQKTGPVWQNLSELSEKGVFLPVPMKTAEVVGKDGRRRMTEDEYYMYVKETGKEYKQVIEKYGDSLNDMKPDRAKKLLSKLATVARQKAKKRVQQKARLR